MQLAKRLNTITEPQTIRMAKMSRELKASGINIIDLSLGEPDFRTPDHIANAAVKAIELGMEKVEVVIKGRGNGRERRFGQRVRRSASPA